MTFADAKQRFSNRAADYVRYRPGYPSELLDVLRKECDLRPGHVIADIGSGTGFLSELFLKNGNAVFGVEPNREMREAGELHLQSYRGFVSVEGSAEATTLPEACADFVAAGQAFHWFEPEKTRAEFRRILRPQGWVVAIWNFREMETPFARAYEDILVKYGTDYTRVRDSYPKGHEVQSFFLGGEFLHHTVPQHESSEARFARQSIKLYFRSDDALALHAALKAKGHLVTDPQMTFYGAREFVILDCNGFI